MDQLSVITGNLYRKYDTADQDYIWKRMPAIGAQYQDSLGRKFVFVSTAVDVAAGQVVASPASAAELANVSAGIAGTNIVNLTRASTTKDQFAGGTLCVTEGTGKSIYVIKSNTASGEINLVSITLEDNLVATVASGSADVILTPSRYAKVIIGTASLVGVGVAITPSTANTDSVTNFMWVQTSGPGGAIIGTGAGGTIGVALAQGAAGVVEVNAAAGTPVIAISTAASAVSNGDIVPCVLKFA